MMNKLFTKPTVKEQVRTSQRDIGRGVRDLERELVTLKREEAKLVTDIKKAAAKGDTAGARVLAKSLVRLRAQMAKMTASTAALRGVRTTVTTAAATATVGTSMATATKAMAAVGTATNPQKIQQDMMNFAKENQKMEMATEMMDDAIDDAYDDDETEDETTDIMNQVLDEIGVDIHSKLSAAPVRKQRVGQASAAAAEEEGDELTNRLAALR